MNTIVAFNLGSRAFAGYEAPIFSCCDIYGNEGGDWVGEIADQAGVNGNICLDPLFCNPAEADFHLRDDSPCRGHSPESPDCDRMGAWPVGCEAAGVAGSDPLFDDGLRIRPNPTKGACSIDFATATSEPSRIAIFDAGGRLVRSIAEGTRSAGDHTISWSGRAEDGRAVSAGLYLVRITSGSWMRTGRVIVTR